MMLGIEKGHCVYGSFNRKSHLHNLNTLRFVNRAVEGS